MSLPALLPPAMDTLASPPDPRRAYEELLVRAMRCAKRFLPHEEAFELAHDVAVELLDRPSHQITATLLYIRITSRVLNLRRSAGRRAALDGEYLAARPNTPPAWAQPGAGLEAGELRERINAAVLTMPSAMRDAFCLVRVQELSYKDAATQLDVSVSTVHTQLSRANAILRECVQRYHADSLSAHRSPKGRQP